MYFFFFLKAGGGGQGNPFLPYEYPNHDQSCTF